ncbi:MAG: dTMP kinase [Alphaproteobacteria bacterium]|nr:dTMP kinase [Alphaproteobacteria bacterium]
MHFDHNTNSGIFITFEGGDGSGKSTQVKLLYKYLLENNYPVIMTREPGGTQISEQLRTILLQGNVNKMNAITEALIFLAARSDNWEKLIKPALDSNKIVICDRFQDSTIVYQGICNNININLLNNICNTITNNMLPNRTYLINIDPVIGLKRSMRQDNVDIRFEHKSTEYHKRIQEAYLRIANNNDRYLIIDGNLSIEEINNIIIKDVWKIMGKAISKVTN